MKFIDTLARNLNSDGATERSFGATLAATSAGRGHYEYWLGTAGPKWAHPAAQVFSKNGRLLGEVHLVDGIWRA